MGFFERILKGIDYQKDERKEREFPRPAPYTPKKFSGYTAQEYYESEGGKAKNFLMFSPASYDDVEIIIDHLKNHEAVIINLRDIKSVIAQRILDFLSGAIYSLDGSIQPIENGLFLLTPGGVGILQKKE
jgi:cell division inhibitor SepF